MGLIRSEVGAYSFGGGAYSFGGGGLFEDLRYTKNEHGSQLLSGGDVLRRRKVTS